MSNTRARQTGNFYMPGEKKIEIPGNPFSGETEKRNEDKKAKELADRLKEAHEAKQKEIEERLEGLELMPNGNRVIVMPYPSNPYVKVMSEGGIFIQPTGTFMNPDSGTLDTLEEVVICAKVIQIGPDCKTIKNGDDVYVDKRSMYPLPFMSLGYQTVAEQQIIALINNDLKERLKMNDGE